MNTNQQATSQAVWILLDSPSEGDLTRYSGPLQIDVGQLKQYLQSFASAMAETLEGCRLLAGDFELQEVSMKAKLSAEAGFMLVSKAGIEGGIDLKFVRNKVR